MTMLLAYSSARAEPTAENIIRLFNRGDAEIVVYVAGVEQGFGWMNSHLLSRNQQRIYYLPYNLALTPSQDIKILSDYLKATKRKGDQIFGLNFLNALADKFPCSPNREGK